MTRPPRVRPEQARIVGHQGRAVLAGAGARADGILQDKPENQGDACLVATTGRSKVKAGGSFSINAVLTPDASGKLVEAGTGDIPIGTATEASTGDGQIVSALITPQIGTI